MTPEALLAKHGIHLESAAPGRHYTTCPKCSAGRSQAHQKLKVLGVTIENDAAHWGCNHCGWTGPEKGFGAARGGREQSFAATYDYADASGKVLFQKVRNPPGQVPRFWCRQPNGRGGWIKGLKEVDDRPLYRLPEVLEAIAAGREIAVVEGEKDADRLWSMDLPATCNFDGAADTTKSPKVKPKWKAEYSERLRGARLVVFNDNDPQGHAHADAVCRMSVGIAASVRRLDLALHWPEIPKGGDVSDYLAAGGDNTPERLLALIEAAPDYVPVSPSDEASSPPPIDTAAPLEGLVKRTAADPGAPFAPEALESLAALKANDCAAFQRLRAQLKKVGCRVTALDEAIAEESGDTGGRGPTQADILLELAQAAELFHAPDATGFADLDVNGHRETWPIRTKGFRRWLARRFYEKTGGAPGSEAMQSAIGVIEAKAHFDGPERVVHVRVGGLDGKIYLDLCDATWRAIEIDSTGWHVIDNPPVRFRRTSGMLPLPAPVAGGEIEDLWPFLNVQTEADFVLAVAWALAALRNRGPYPVIVLSGEQGSAKSTFCGILRALLDPSTSPLRALPREDRDLFIAASNAHVLAFDNISGLPWWISDTLCRLATGGGFAVRQLYTDQDEMLFDATRPVILNGIEEIIDRPDLADRAVILTLEPIPEMSRRTEKELWADFETKRPQILGVLLDAVAMGLKRLPNTRLKRLPRMADFALWATACESAFWPAGTFWSAYCENRDDAIESVIEADSVATTVRAFMTGRARWEGTAAELLGALGEVAGEKVTRAKTWPENPRALSGRLRRAAASLRKVGIEVEFKRAPKTGTRTITITFSELEREGDFASPPSPSSQPKDFNDLGVTVGVTQTGGGDANGRDSGPTVTPTVTAKSLKTKAGDGGDGSDANFPPYSGLSDKAISNLAKQYLEWSEAEFEAAHNIDSAALDRRLRETLASGGVPPGLIAAEFERIMKVVFAGI